MRLDHVAYRVADRWATARFFMEAFGYKLQTEFDIVFPDGSTTKCIALEPPEKLDKSVPWTVGEAVYLPDPEGPDGLQSVVQEYHLPPEIFVSDGSPDSIVGRWVAHRDGVGGIHHMAYLVNSVEEKMNEWKEKGYAEFSSVEPMKCPGLTQVFTRPSALTGVIYEFIERGEHGFCKDNVQALMESTKDNK